MTVSEFHNPCGGVKWRQQSNWLVEVEGAGAIVPPAATSPYSFRRYVADTWKNFAPEIRAAAKKRGVPASWILAFGATETGLWSSNRTKQATISNFCCAGVMAVMVTPSPNHKMFGGYPNASDMLDPAKNIDTGAAILRSFADKFGWDLPALTPRYNAGPARLCAPGRNTWNLYVDNISGVPYTDYIVRANNMAITELRTNGDSTLAYAVAGAAVVGLGAMVWLHSLQ